MSSDVSDSAIPAKVRMISTLNSWISEEVLAMVDDSRARMSEIMRAEMRGVSMRGSGTIGTQCAGWGTTSPIAALALPRSA